ncbi:hypothetical protein EVAR_47783_1 [Eumeta japonica]|uniref:Uncharacterized protein n=1 Tax=Eumeta variegata TaxID=151549 RepID=A0A4C1XW00_EUMVA|nr:hypothetical protein EVAR_47783_1 [Eumeta japonica]
MPRCRVHAQVALVSCSHHFRRTVYLRGDLKCTYKAFAAELFITAAGGGVHALIKALPESELSFFPLKLAEKQSCRNIATPEKGVHVTCNLCNDKHLCGAAWVIPERGKDVDVERLSGDILFGITNIDCRSLKKGNIERKLPLLYEIFIASEISVKREDLLIYQRWGRRPREAIKRVQTNIFEGHKSGRAIRNYIVIATHEHSLLQRNH